MTHVRQTDRAFGFTVASLCAAIAVSVWALFDVTLVWPWLLAGAFLAAAVAFPGVLLPVNRLWGGFVTRLGQLNNFLLLGLFFCLVVVPAGFLIRLLGKDPMPRVPDRNAKSYWFPVKRQADTETFRDMF